MKNTLREQLIDGAKKLNEAIDDSRVFDSEIYELEEIIPASHYFTVEEDGKIYRLKLSLSCLTVIDK